MPPVRVGRLPFLNGYGHWMSGTHMMLFVGVALMTAAFSWQVRKERQKLLYFLVGIGVGCSMVALLTY